MSLAEIKYGTTPWDDLPRAELLEHVRRLFSAVHSAQSVLGMMAARESTSPYWSSIGSGGRALVKLRQAEQRALGPTCPGELYKAFYRYADDLLFAAPIGYGWRVCAAGHMTGSTPGELSAVACFICERLGVHADMRPLTWADLAP